MKRGNWQSRKARKQDVRRCARKQGVPPQRGAQPGFNLATPAAPQASGLSRLVDAAMSSLMRVARKGAR